MLTLRNLVAGLTFASCAVVVAACGGVNNAAAPPTPGPTCSPGETVQMVYPIPGATGVPTNVSEVVFAMPSPLPGYWGGYVNYGNTLAGGAYTAYGVQTITAAQVPTPAASPTIANPVYQKIPFAGTFLPDANVYIWLNNTNSTCTPYGPVGNFSTQ